MKGVVLSLCDRTGNITLPWLEAGYQAITVDLQEAPTAHVNRHHFVADVTRWRYRSASVSRQSSSHSPPALTWPSAVPAGSGTKAWAR
jgi:hypothetical protein